MKSNFKELFPRHINGEKYKIDQKYNFAFGIHIYKMLSNNINKEKIKFFLIKEIKENWSDKNIKIDLIDISIRIYNRFKGLKTRGIITGINEPTIESEFKNILDILNPGGINIDNFENSELFNDFIDKIINYLKDLIKREEESKRIIKSASVKVEEILIPKNATPIKKETLEKNHSNKEGGIEKAENNNPKTLEQEAEEYLNENESNILCEFDINLDFKKMKFLEGLDSKGLREFKKTIWNLFLKRKIDKIIEKMISSNETISTNNGNNYEIVVFLKEKLKEYFKSRNMLNKSGKEEIVYVQSEDENIKITDDLTEYFKQNYALKISERQELKK